MITGDHLARLEQRHDRMWICHTLLEDPLLLHKSGPVCYSIIAFYSNQEWFEAEGIAVSRVRALELVNGCIGSTCR